MYKRNDLKWKRKWFQLKCINTIFFIKKLSSQHSEMCDFLQLQSIMTSFSSFSYHDTSLLSLSLAKIYKLLGTFMVGKRFCPNNNVVILVSVILLKVCGRSISKESQLQNWDFPLPKKELKCSFRHWLALEKDPLILFPKEM